MAIYCYKTRHGQLAEEEFPIGTAPPSIQILTPHGMEEAFRDYQAEQGGIRGERGLWPKTSDAVGVLPQQREEAMRESKEVGVPTVFNDAGQAVFRSRRHLNQYLRATGRRDNDAGYGDYAGE